MIPVYRTLTADEMACRILKVWRISGRHPSPPRSALTYNLQTFWCFGGFGLEGTLQGTLKLQAIILVDLDNLSRLR